MPIPSLWHRVRVLPGPTPTPLPPGGIAIPTCLLWQTSRHQGHILNSIATTSLCELLPVCLLQCGRVERISLRLRFIVHKMGVSVSISHMWGCGVD